MPQEQMTNRIVSTVGLAFISDNWQPAVFSLDVVLAHRFLTAWVVLSPVLTLSRFRDYLRQSLLSSFLWFQMAWEAYSQLLNAAVGDYKRFQCSRIHPL